ncbi:ubiquinol-cytochrome c reductase-like protein [Sarcoptes scabiei]|uniref:Cytochrome b-c1 complex subunit 8 n=1 Tax=Sarcoptes scabiei TaxID=52283 RepID=A0A131ZTS1_SARSC|nr:ubiquinol-cytochrome c reductase-like protein [Sarcoptes scabiei]
MGGKKFGNLAFIRNVIYIRLSPYEQRAFPNFFSNTWNGFKRDFTNIFPYAAPPTLGAYLIYLYGKQENERLSRKNPADYVNDS